MKKKIYSVLFLTVAAVLMCACDDKFLDKTPLDKLTEDAVFNSVGLAENHVNSMYSVLPDFLQEGNIGAISDEGYFRYGGTSTRYIAAGTMDPDNIVYMQEGGAAHNNRTTVLNIWNRSYKYLRDMNYFIDRVEEGSKMDVADRNRLLGEVYFLRAWTYTNMIERYAGVPLIKHTYKMSDEFGVKRNDFDYCVDEILKDLDKADSLLGPTNGQGRANRVVSKALRSRLTLIAASPLFNDPDKPSISTGFNTMQVQATSTTPEKDMLKLLIKQAKKRNLPFAYIVEMPLRQSATRLYQVDVKTGAMKLMKTDQNTTPSDDELMNILAVSNKEDLFNVINPYTFTIIYPHSFLLNEIELNKATMEVQKEFEIPYPVSE